MATTEPVSNSDRSVNSNSAVQRLERISKNLLSLRTKLSSYKCEPKTLTLYELKEKLKFRLDKMTKSNKELIMSLKSRKLISEKTRTKANDQVESYKKLENKVLEYIRIAKLHC